MTLLATSLLKGLLSTQSASASSSADASASAGGSGVNFANLLSSARKGQVTSDRPVAEAEEVKGKLTAQQLSRIGIAADCAESTGMSTALVMIDGKAVKLDVASREITDVMDPRTAAITGIDGVLAAPPSSLSAEVSGTPAASTSIAGALEQQLLAKLGGGSRAGVQPFGLSALRR